MAARPYVKQCFCINESLTLLWFTKSMSLVIASILIITGTAMVLTARRVQVRRVKVRVKR
jgi:hypothetical protein